MVRFKGLGRLLGLSLIGTLAFIGVAVHSFQVDGTKKNHNNLDIARTDFLQAVKDFKHDPKTWDNPQTIQVETADLRRALTSGTSSPLKVRGGSMTVFNSVTDDWDPTGGGPYCVDIKYPTQITIEDFVEGSNFTGRVTLPTVLVGWTVTVVGHDPDDTRHNPHHHGDSPSWYKLQFKSQDKPCKQEESAKSSVTMTLLNPDQNPKVGFYKLSLPPKGPWKSNLRFQDNSGGYDPADGGGKKDGEFRERMYGVEIKDAAGNVLHSYTCPDGDCAIYMGAPQ